MAFKFKCSLCGKEINYKIDRRSWDDHLYFHLLAYHKAELEGIAKERYRGSLSGKGKLILMHEIIDKGTSECFSDREDLKKIWEELPVKVK
jgi:hypothetical protein